MLLLIDNRDSFTFNLVQAFQALGTEVVVRRSERLSVREVETLRPERLLVGPGPGGPEEAGESLALIRAFAGRLPILGVCLGCQAIARAYGARIGPAREPVHGRAVEVEHDGHGVFAGLSSPLSFARYNSLAVLEEDFPTALEIGARAFDGDVMAVRHRELCLEGVLFHPESIRSADGAGLLANFLAVGG